MKKILFVFGTRPEAIKLAPVILEVKKHQKIVLTKVLITAQHREMMDEVLEVFKIKPDFDLNIMLPNQTLSEVTSRILTGVEDILKRERPNLVFVQGDTTTVLATALACYYQRITLVHVEAGLRSFDKFQPFPEEINRRLVSHIADFNFAPTEEAAENLLNEGIERKKILVTGNTVIDALFMAIKKKGSFSEELDKVDFNKRLILLTAHRRENFGLPLENICQAVKEISKLGEDLEIVYPVHLNPNVQETVRKILRNIPNVKLLKPLDYLSFCHLMKKSYLILTDSGGIQEEASSLNKPILVLRNVTERPEVIKTGAAILVGTDQKKIVRETKSLLEDEQKYRRMGTVSNPFGDGKASERIVKWIIKRLINKK